MNPYAKQRLEEFEKFLMETPVWDLPKRDVSDFELKFEGIEEDTRKVMGELARLVPLGNASWQMQDKRSITIPFLMRKMLRGLLQKVYDLKAVNRQQQLKIIELSKELSKLKRSKA